MYLKFLSLKLETTHRTKFPYINIQDCQILLNRTKPVVRMGNTSDKRHKHLTNVLLYDDAKRDDIVSGKQNRRA